MKRRIINYNYLNYGRHKCYMFVLPQWDNTLFNSFHLKNSRKSELGVILDVYAKLERLMFIHYSRYDKFW